MDLKGKSAIVTGGSRGIGRAICLKLAKLGADVAINYYPGLKEEAEELKKEIEKIGSRGYPIEADISKMDEAKKLIEQAVATMGKVDILVNNAGITRDSLILRMSEDDWESVLAVNLKGVFNCSQAVAKYMVKERKGVIINISSVVGLRGNIGQANYAASKAGVIGFTKSLAKELGSRGIRVNAVAPGFIETGMTQGFPQEYREKILKQIPLGRFGLPKDVASLVAFLASDEASYITGEVISVNGGIIL